MYSIMFRLYGTMYSKRLDYSTMYSITFRLYSTMYYKRLDYSTMYSKRLEYIVPCIL